MLTQNLRKKTILSAAFILCLLLFIFSTAAMSASANEADRQPYQIQPDTAVYTLRAAEEETHKHAVNGASGNYTFQPLTLEILKQKNYKLESGYYYLAEDINTPTTITLDADFPDVKLCLNGHVLKKTGTGSVINFAVVSRPTLYICDCQPDTLHTDRTDLPAEIAQITGGLITGGKATNGGGIDMYSNTATTATLTLYGGTIAGNTATGNGGGISAKSYGITLNINGGTICNNIANFGGGIYIGSGNTASISSGRIINNTAQTSGGGIYHGTTMTNLTISGAEIADNQALGTADGNGGGGIYSVALIRLSGGNIHDNYAANIGGGILSSTNPSTTGTYTEEILRATGSNQEENSPRVENNTASSSHEPNNVYINYKRTGRDPNFVYHHQIIELPTSELKNGAHISFSIKLTPAEEELLNTGISVSIPISTAATSETIDYNVYAGYLSADNPNDSIIYDSETKKLYYVKNSTPHIHYGDTNEYTPIADLSTPLAPGGYYHLPAESDITLTDTVVIEGDVHLCLNGSTVTPAEGKPVFTIKPGASLQLSGCSSQTLAELIGNGSITIEQGGRLELVSNQSPADPDAAGNAQVIEATNGSVTTEVNENGQIVAPGNGSADQTHQEIHEEYTADHTQYDVIFTRDLLSTKEPVAQLRPEYEQLYYYLPAGNYYLTEDIQLDMAVEVQGTTNLCLFDHNLTAYNSTWEYDMDHVFWVPDKAVLNVFDCLNDLTIIWLPGGSVHLRNGGRLNINGNDGSQISFTMTDGEGGGGTISSTDDYMTLPKGLEISKTNPSGQPVFNLSNDGETITLTTTNGSGQTQTTTVQLEQAAPGSPSLPVLAPIIQGSGDSQSYAGDELRLPDKAIIQNPAGDQITLQKKPETGSAPSIGSLASDGILTTEHIISIQPAGSSPSEPPVVITSPGNGQLTVAPSGSTAAPAGSTISRGEISLELDSVSQLPADGTVTISPDGELTLPAGSQVTATLPADDSDNPDNPNRGHKTIVIALPNLPENADLNLQVNDSGLTLPGGTELKPQRGNKTIVIALPDGQEHDVWFDDEGRIILPEGTRIDDPDKPGEPIITNKDNNTYDPETGELGNTENLPEKPDRPERPDNPDTPDTPQGLPTGGSVTTEDGSQIHRPDEDTVVITPGSEGKPSVTIKNEAKNESPDPTPGFDPKVDKDGNVHVEAPFSVKADDDKPEIKVNDTQNEPAIISPEGAVELPKGGSLEVAPPDGSDPIKVTVPETGGAVAPQPDGTITLPPNSKVEIDGQITQVGSKGGKLDPANKTVTSNSTGSSGGGGGSSAQAAQDTTNTYEITASASFGGSITPSGKVTVAKGASQGFSITPNPGYIIEAVIIDGKDIGTPEKYTFENVQAAHRIEAIFAASRSSRGHIGCPKDETCPIWPYTDAIPTDWYHDGVHYCIENGLMIGTAPELWEPNIPLTRGMLAQVLYNRAGKPEVTGNRLFDDVADTSEWYWQAITWGGRHNVLLGYGNGCFGPKDPVTREQLATMLWRFAGRPEGSAASSFGDSGQISSWAAEAVSWASQTGIVNGYPDGSFKPQGFASRAEAAQMIQRYFAR